MTESQLTLRHLREFGIAPNTNLGQHFLVDDNILRVIEGLAALDAVDVVYEPGAGVGVLSDFLARRVAHVHAVELDRRMEPALAALCGAHPNLTVHWGDALDVDVAILGPAPTKLVSNLPYHVAAPIVAEALQHLPQLGVYCVMVQKEVGERLFATVGGSNYGAISVLVQATCTRTGTHAVSRRVFVPPPNVDSVLVAFSRDRALLTPVQVPAFAAFVKRAFAHRRKTLANNLGMGGTARALTVGALAAIGHKPAARPQELSADQFVAVFEAVGGAKE